MLSAIQVEDSALRQQLDELPQRLSQAVERGLRRATELLRGAVAALAEVPLGVAAASPFGEFAASVTTEVTDESGQKVGRVFLAPPADRYGLFVEVGTRPHFPPPGALEGWVRRRLGVTQDRQAREVAFLIARKIARAGTPGHHFFERALEANQHRVVAVMEQEIARAVT